MPTWPILRTRIVLLVGTVLVLAACSPKPPTITPERGVVTAVGPAGVELKVELRVDNPNSVSINVRAVDARVVLLKEHDLGRVTVSLPMELPARHQRRLEVPLSIRWADLPSLLLLAASRKAIAYDVDGTVALGGELVQVEVPFHLSGQITPEELAQATRNSLPGIPIP
jgi:LEA14-like dessication related protein